MHLTVSLLIECNGEITNGEYGRKVLCDYLKMLCQSHKLAGGSIVSMRDPQLFMRLKMKSNCVKSSGG